MIDLGQTKLDDDPLETAESLDALEGVVLHSGAERARYLFDRLAAHASPVGASGNRQIWAKRKRADRTPACLEPTAR